MDDDGLVLNLVDSGAGIRRHVNTKSVRWTDKCVIKQHHSCKHSFTLLTQGKSETGSKTEDKTRCSTNEPTRTPQKSVFC